jgi:hypothetical protein
MRAWRAVVVIMLTASMMGFAAPEASAACSLSGTWFKAYDGTYCSGDLLKKVNAPAGTRNISVARDRTSSGSNSTANKYCGVNEGINDQTVFVWGPNDISNVLGDANNIIDHFDVVLPSQSCPA